MFWLLLKVNLFELRTCKLGVETKIAVRECIKIIIFKIYFAICDVCHRNLAMFSDMPVKISCIIIQKNLGKD